MGRAPPQSSGSGHLSTDERQGGEGTNLQLHKGVQRGERDRQGSQEESRGRRCFRNEVPCVGGESMGRREDKEGRRALSRSGPSPARPPGTRPPGPGPAAGWCPGSPEPAAPALPLLGELPGPGLLTPGGRRARLAQLGGLALCQAPRRSFTRRDPPLEEALCHVQAVDSEVFQGRIIQIDISN